MWSEDAVAEAGGRSIVSTPRCFLLFVLPVPFCLQQPAPRFSLPRQAIAFMLADMAAGIEASRLLYLKSAYEIDQARHSAA